MVLPTPLNPRKSFILGSLFRADKSEPRIKLFRGFIGVGKTTAMLHILGENKDKAFYFYADNPIIQRYGIYNTVKAASRYGFTIMLIDEIHTYPNWKNELKILTDEVPTLCIVASGSAPLALVPERREELICLHEMTLYEMVSLKKGETKPAKDEWKDKEDRKSVV